MLDRVRSQRAWLIPMLKEFKEIRAAYRRCSERRHRNEQETINKLGNIEDSRESDDEIESIDDDDAY